VDEEERPVVRPTARVLLLDPADRVLLFRTRDPDDPDHPFWYPPGGRVEVGETVEEAARREVLEETGFDVELGPLIGVRRHVVSFAGVWADVRETWFLARASTSTVDTTGFTPLEVATIEEHRWWTLEELEATGDPLTPRALAALVRDLLRNGPPPTPLTLDV
jgi:ADP-ribose pyrophosphatase YjhB (NUDIX family)